MYRTNSSPTKLVHGKFESMTNNDAYCQCSRKHTQFGNTRNCVDCGRLVDANLCHQPTNPTQITVSPMQLLESMRQNETCFEKTTPDSCYDQVARKQMLNEIENLNRAFQQNETTVALAIELMDRFCLKQQISQEEIKIFSGSALMVASKFDEIDYNVIKASKLASYYSRDVGFYQMNSTRAFTKAEKLILMTFDWDIKVPTPLHFLYTYATCGIALKNENQTSILTRSMQIYTNFVNSQNYLTVRSQIKPSQIAAAIVRAARKHQRCQKRWPETFVKITNYSERELRKVPYSQQAKGFILNSTMANAFGNDCAEIHSSPEKSPQKEVFGVHFDQKKTQGFNNNVQHNQESIGQRYDNQQIKVTFRSPGKQENPEGEGTATKQRPLIKKLQPTTTSAQKMKREKQDQDLEMAKNQYALAKFKLNLQQPSWQEQNKAQNNVTSGRSQVSTAPVTQEPSPPNEVIQTNNQQPLHYLIPKQRPGEENGLINIPQNPLDQQFGIGQPKYTVRTTDQSTERREPQVSAVQTNFVPLRCKKVIPVGLEQSASKTSLQNLRAEEHSQSHKHTRRDTRDFSAQNPNREYQPVEIDYIQRTQRDIPKKNVDHLKQQDKAQVNNKRPPLHGSSGKKSTRNKEDQSSRQSQTEMPSKFVQEMTTPQDMISKRMYDLQVEREEIISAMTAASTQNPGAPTPTYSTYNQGSALSGHQPLRPQMKIQSSNADQDRRQAYIYEDDNSKVGRRQSSMTRHVSPKTQFEPRHTPDQERAPLQRYPSSQTNLMHLKEYKKPDQTDRHSNVLAKFGQDINSKYRGETQPIALQKMVKSENVNTDKTRYQQTGYQQSRKVDIPPQQASRDYPRHYNNNYESMSRQYPSRMEQDYVKSNSKRSQFEPNFDGSGLVTKSTGLDRQNYYENNPVSLRGTVNQMPQYNHPSSAKPQNYAVNTYKAAYNESGNVTSVQTFNDFYRRDAYNNQSTTPKENNYLKDAKPQVQEQSRYGQVRQQKYDQSSYNKQRYQDQHVYSRQNPPQSYSYLSSNKI